MQEIFCYLFLGVLLFLVFYSIDYLMQRYVFKRKIITVTVDYSLYLQLLKVGKQYNYPANKWISDNIEYALIDLLDNELKNE